MKSSHRNITQTLIYVLLLNSTCPAQALTQKVKDCMTKFCKDTTATYRLIKVADESAKAVTRIELFSDVKTHQVHKKVTEVKKPGGPLWMCQIKMFKLSFDGVGSTDDVACYDAVRGILHEAVADAMRRQMETELAKKKTKKAI